MACSIASFVSQQLSVLPGIIQEVTLAVLAEDEVCCRFLYERLHHVLRFAVGCTVVPGLEQSK